MILSPEELQVLTGKLRSDAQARELEHLGIPYQKRRDGSLLVLRRNVEIPSATIPREPRLRLNNGASP